MRKLATILALYLTIISDVSGQGFSYITMGPNGETLVCTPVKGGGTFCVEQR